MICLSDRGMSIDRCVYTAIIHPPNLSLYLPWPKITPRRKNHEGFEVISYSILCPNNKGLSFWQYNIGCYNCSQRRINCDRGTPACQKCLKKGLECLGLGTRYRFQNGVASRGKLAGKTLPLRNAEYVRLLYLFDILTGLTTNQWREACITPASPGPGKRYSHLGRLP